MPSWPLVRLGDLVEVLDHLRVPVREEDREDGQVPYYGANGQQGWIDRPLFDEPLILLAEDGGHFDEYATRDIAYRIEGLSWVNNHAHVIRAVAGHDQGFLYWALRNKDIRRYISGGTRGKLTQGELHAIEIKMPPLAEQRRIAEVLDTIEERIQATERLITKLRSVRSGLLRDLMRPAALDERQVLGDVVTLRGGFGFPEAFQGNGSGEIPFFKVSDMNTSGNERYMRVANHYVSVRLASARGWKVLPRDAVVFAKVGAALLLNRRRLLTGDSLVDNNMMGAIVSSSVNPAWLYWWLQTIDFGVFVQPGALPSVNQAQLASLPMALPPMETQDRVAVTLDAMDETIDAHDHERHAMLKLRSGLATDLLTGQPRTVPTDHATGADGVH